MNGKITKYFEDKGFGFAKGEDGLDYFIHVNAMRDINDKNSLKVGQTVKFDPFQSARGLQGVNVSIITYADAGHTNSQERFVLLESGEVWRTKGNAFGGYTILAKANYYVRGNTRSSGSSPDEARMDMLAKAAAIGANAVIHEQYAKGTGSSGNYRFTTHHFSGVPVVIGKLNGSGLPRDEIDLPDMDGNIAEFIESARQKQIAKYIAFTFLFVGLLSAITVMSGNALVGLIGGAGISIFLLLMFGRNEALETFQAIE